MTSNGASRFAMRQQEQIRQGETITYQLALHFLFIVSLVTRLVV